MGPALRLVVAAFVGLVLGMLPARAANDLFASKQWNLPLIGAEPAWRTGIGAGITIAVVDTGVHFQHEDLAGRVLPGRNFVTEGSPPQDDNGHGTHVAGIAAAAADNGAGIAGVAPGVKILPVRVLGPDGSGSIIDVQDGIRWAADNGAHVVNLSLGDDVQLPAFGPTFVDAVEYAWLKGSIVVLAAGNSGSRNIDAISHHAIVVTSTDPQDRKPTYASNVGNAMYRLAAPGGAGAPPGDDDIISSYWTASGGNQVYAWAAGTSMAAPHVSAAAAILRGLGLSRDQAVQRLRSTAKDLGDPGEDTVFGSGRLDLAKAVDGLNPAATTLTTNQAGTTTTTARGGSKRSAGGTVVTPTTRTTTTGPHAVAKEQATSTTAGTTPSTAVAAEPRPDDGVRLEELGPSEEAAAPAGSNDSGGDTPVWPVGIPAAAALAGVGRAAARALRRS